MHPNFYFTICFKVCRPFRVNIEWLPVFQIGERYSSFLIYIDDASTTYRISITFRLCWFIYLCVCRTRVLTTPTTRKYILPRKERNVCSIKTNWKFAMNTWPSRCFEVENFKLIKKTDFIKILTVFFYKRVQTELFV